MMYPQIREKAYQTEISFSQHKNLPWIIFLTGSCFVWMLLKWTFFKDDLLDFLMASLQSFTHFNQASKKFKMIKYGLAT